MTHLLTRLFAALLALNLALVPALANDLGNSTWSETDSSNNSASPNGWTTGMLPSQVEPTARAMMGAIRRFYDHITPTLVATGAANVITLNYTVAPASLARECFMFYPSAANTGATTLNVNGLGAKSVLINGAALVGGELVTSNMVLMCYDGTNFQIVANAGVYAAWTLYTPTATCVTGSITSTTQLGGRYKIIGKTVFVAALIQVNLIGTCRDGLTLSLPSGMTAAASGIAGWTCTAGYLNGATLGLARASVSLAGTSISLLRSDGTFPALNSDAYTVSCTVEIQ